jgi:hypothetical protein
MAATQADLNVKRVKIDTYITDIADYGSALARQQEIGNHDTWCGRVKLMLLSGYLDCLYDYFLQYLDDIDPDTTNLFTKVEIRDVMQHVNNICGTFYIIEV